MHGRAKTTAINMTITDEEMNDLLDGISSKGEREIAMAVFSVESVLREIISLIAAHPERLKVHATNKWFISILINIA